MDFIKRFLSFICFIYFLYFQCYLDKKRKEKAGKKSNLKCYYNHMMETKIFKCALLTRTDSETV